MAWSNLSTGRKLLRVGLLSGAGCMPLVVLTGFIFLAALFGLTHSASGGNPGGGSGPGASNQIPAVLQPIFQKAADKYNISVNLVGAIFWEEHGHSFPTAGPWASSPVGASGPFQFMPSTWDNGHGGGYQEDCNADGVADIQSLDDASCAAAHYLASAGATRTFTTSASDLQKVYNAAFAYNHADFYASAVRDEYVTLTGSAQ